LVELAIQDTTTALYWNGTSWGVPLAWVPATGTVSWSYPFTPVQGVTYNVSGRASDNYGEVEGTPSSSTFWVGTLGAVVVVTTSGEYLPETWVGMVQGTAADPSGVSLVEVQIRRTPDGLHWNGTEWQADPVWIPATGGTTWVRTFMAELHVR
jgi:hypothetical protein